MEVWLTRGEKNFFKDSLGVIVHHFKDQIIILRDKLKTFINLPQLEVNHVKIIVEA